MTVYNIKQLPCFNTCVPYNDNNAFSSVVALSLKHMSNARVRAEPLPPPTSTPDISLLCVFMYY